LKNKYKNKIKLNQFVNAQQGLTLIELLIASMLGIFLLSVLMTAYVGIKRSYHFHEALVQIQETGRIATQLMTDDIHNAGFSGCSKVPTDAIKLPGTNKILSWRVHSFIPTTLNKRVLKDSTVSQSKFRLLGRNHQISR